LRNNKAADRKKTVGEMLRNLGKGGLFQLAAVMQEIWVIGVGPKAWSTIDIIPVWKGKGDKSVCDNYRPIAVIDIFSKAFGILLKERVEKVIAGKLLECQAGFRRKRSTQDMIFTMRLLRGYSREMKRALFACFVDLRKAYDSVDREALWNVLSWYGVDDHLLKMIQLLYYNLKATIRVGGERSDKIDLKSGVKQGCVLSPLLFNIYLDFVMRQAIIQFENKGVTVMRGEETCWHESLFRNRLTQKGEFLISALLYADDTALLALSYDDLCEMIRVLDHVTCEWGLTISIEKTKIVVFGGCLDDNRIPMMLRGEQIKEVDEFKYLGSVFTSDGTDTKDLDTRINKGWARFLRLKKEVWKQRGFNLNTKIHLYKLMVVPVILYGTESWVLTQTEEKKLEAAQMKMLRSILRIRWFHHASNTEVSNRAGVVMMKDHLRRGRLQWFGKVMRMTDDRLPKIVLCGCLGGVDKRPMGRPPVRWCDKIKSDLEALGVDFNTCIDLAKDEREWQDICTSMMENDGAKTHKPNGRLSRGEDGVWRRCALEQERG
jgi:hypothetical protein